jgi:type II secretory pathway component PulJ
MRCRGSRPAGFSLLELMFAFLISLTALLLASRLLLEAESRMAHAARQALDPVGEITRQQLRADLRAASGARVPITPGWSRNPLVLDGHPAGRVRYEKDGSELVRRVDAGGGPPVRRVVLQAVTTFRWRLADGSVEIDLGHRVTPRLGRLAAGGVREAPLPSEERRRFRVTPRGQGGRRW